MTQSPITNVRAWLSATPVVLPRYLDQLSEWWWSKPPRVRAVTPVVTVLLLAGMVSVTTAQDETVAVLVATRDIASGTAVTVHDVATQQRPRAYVPPGHTNAVDGVALGPIPKGTVLTGQHLSDGGASVRLAADRVAVAVPRDVVPPVVIGDTVTLLDVSFDTAGAPFSETATLFHVDGDVLWFAVDPHDAASITAAAHGGRIGAIVHPRHDRP